jgi:hypothetical protein
LLCRNRSLTGFERDDPSGASYTTRRDTTPAGAIFRSEPHNLYDRETGRWLQFWMDSQGDVTRFEGGPTAESAMVLVATHDRGPDFSGEMTQRMTFTRNPNGSVRQLGEGSTDGGATWEARYDFTYKRRAAP